MMHCDEFEVLLADSLDGELDPARRQEFIAHRNSCGLCSALEADARSAMSFIERVAEPEMPAELTAKILAATNAGWELKLRGKGVRGWINRTFAPVLQPRMVMGAMLTLMSLTMLTRCAGGPKHTLTAADLDPVKLWFSLDDRVHRAWDRTVKSYEGMRVVYEIRSQLNDWKQKQQQEEEAAAEAKANSRQLDKPSPTGQEKKQ